jgi:hypothetical protein
MNEAFRYPRDSEGREVPLTIEELDCRMRDLLLQVGQLAIQRFSATGEMPNVKSRLVYDERCVDHTWLLSIEDTNLDPVYLQLPKN